LTPNSPPAVKTQRGAGPRHFVFHPNRRLVFGVDELDATVNAYRLDAAGTLTLLASTSILPPGFTGKPWAADVHLTPDGRFLYASERTSSTIAGFRVDAASGKLSLVGSYPTETQPRGFGIDPRGRWLLSAGEKSNGVRVHEIDPSSGALHARSRLTVGQDPNWVEIVALPRAPEKP
jgi:6-phosphogluconolactonase